MIFVLASIVLLYSCGEPQAVDTPIVARILSSQGQDTYRFRDVEFETLRDITPIKGDIASIKGGAVIDLNNQIEEVIVSEDPGAIYSNKGRAINVSYTVEDGVVRPKDFTSMAALAIYYNFERTFKYWETFNNLTLEDFGFITIYNNPVTKVSALGGSVELSAKQNAAFLTGARDLWFFKKSKQAIVPIKMNYGIMAHEFFHSMFDLLVANKDPEFYKGSFLNEFQLGAINEGLSDFFSILVTGRKEELGESLEQLQATRIPQP